MWNFVRRRFDLERSFKGPSPSAEAIQPDVPIKSKEQDLLRRASFAERISMVLSELSVNEGRVFAIRGSWGHGKSSLKNLVIEQLNSKPHSADYLEFNPWQWGDGDIITNALFQQIADKLGGALSTGAKSRASKFRKYGSVLTGIAGPLKKVGGNQAAITLILANTSVLAITASLGFDLPTAATLTLYLVGISTLLPVIGSFLAWLGRDRWTKPLGDMRADLEKALSGLTKPLVIFVDDIDRLEPGQITTLIRNIKVNGNLPNLIFVLLFQPSIVEAALDNISNGDGRAFLQKIVQANFDLPTVPSAAIHRAMVAELSKVAGRWATPSNGFEQVRWGNALIGSIQPLIGNLRESRRYLSSVSIHLALHTKGETFEVNVVDFLALEALRVFLPDLHKSLSRERDLLLQRGRYNNDGQGPAQTERLKEMIALAPEGQRETAETALKELFPAIRGHLDGMHYGSEWHMQWTQEKRVCSMRYFPQYFELQTPEGEISESEFARLMAVSGHREHLDEFINALRERDLLKSLASRIDESYIRLPVESAPILLPALFKMAEELAGYEEATPFGSSWTSAWRGISHYIDRLPPEQRGPEVLRAMKETKALSLVSTLIYLSSPDEHQPSSKLERSIDEASVEELKVEWLKIVTDMASTPTELLEKPALGSLLYRWRDYSGSLSAPCAWVASVTADNLAFVKFVQAIVSRGTSHSAGDFVGSTTIHFQRETVEHFLGLEKARQRLGDIETTSLNDDERSSVELLREHVDEWLARSEEKQVEA